MGNMKSPYLQYEVEGDQFCIHEVYGLNLVTSEFSVSCSCFETMDESGVQLEKCCGRTYFD